MSTEDKPPAGQSPPEADKPSTGAEIYSITREDVARFLTEKENKESAKCPICGVNDWAGAAPAEHGALNLLFGDARALSGRGAVNCFVLVCHNCGYVRLFSLGPIIQWKRGE